MSGRSSHSVQSGEDLGSLLQRVLKIVRRDLDGLPARAEERIHDIRVNMKKFRALLRLAAPALDRTTFRETDQVARELKDHFSSARDSDVLRELLLDLLDHREAVQSADTLGLSDGGSHCAPVAAGAIGLCERLDGLVAGFPLARLPISAIYDAWTGTYRAARKARDTAAADDQDELFHEWRKRLKELLYQSQSLAEHPAPADLLPATERLASWLGRHHDLSLLEARLGRYLPDSHAEKVVRRKKSLMARRALKDATTSLGPRPSALRKTFPKS